MPAFTQDDLSKFSTTFEQITDQLTVGLAECIGETVAAGRPAFSIESLQAVSAVQSEFVQCPFAFTELADSQSIAAISRDDAKKILAIMTETEVDPDADISDGDLGHLGSVMGGVALALSLAVSQLTGRTIEPESGETTVSKLNLPPSFALSGEAVKVEMPVTVKTDVEAGIVFFFATDLAVAIGDSAPETPAAPAPSFADEQRDPFGAIFEAADDNGFPSGATPLPSFDPFGQSRDTLPSGIGLIMDIPLDVTVELGRVRMLIKDVLDLSAGSIVELERIAGEPVDLMVNGRLVAKGEVVVIEDNFGIRITEIVSPSDRLNGAAKRN